MAINNLVGGLTGKIKGGVSMVTGGAAGSDKNGPPSSMKALVADKAKMFEFIGMEIYDLYLAGKMDLAVITPFCQKIEVLNAEIGELELTKPAVCECGQKMAGKVKFCPQCGKDRRAEFEAATVPEQPKCVCGATIETGALMCMECGRRVTA